MVKTYWQKLQDPRWQKKRLEAMQDKGFRCELCDNDEAQLNVHHKEYFKGHEPWQYNVGQLAVLCRDCHEGQHDMADTLKWTCSYLALDGPRNRTDAAFLLAGFLGADYPGFLSFAGRVDTKHFQKLYKYGAKASKG